MHINDADARPQHRCRQDDVRQHDAQDDAQDGAQDDARDDARMMPRMMRGVMPMVMPVMPMVAVVKVRSRCHPNGPRGSITVGSTAATDPREHEYSPSRSGCAQPEIG